jgi:hypothetical protein
MHQRHTAIAQQITNGNNYNSSTCANDLSRAFSRSRSLSLTHLLALCFWVNVFLVCGFSKRRMIWCTSRCWPRCSRTRSTSRTISMSQIPRNVPPTSTKSCHSTNEYVSNQIYSATQSSTINHRHHLLYLGDTVLGTCTISDCCSLLLLLLLLCLVEG